MAIIEEPIRFLSIGHLLTDPDWHFPRHKHETFHELIVVTRGRIHVRMGGDDITGVPGDILFYRAGLMHEESSDPDDSLETLFIVFEGSAGAHPPPFIVRDTAGRIREMTGWLFKEWTAGQSDGRLKETLLRTILAEWERLVTHPESIMVKRVRNLMAASINRKISLEELAETAELSKYHFVRTYCRLTGSTPMKDLQLVRVKHAHHLILTTNLSQKEIAKQCGLGNVYYLSRVFRRHFGASPGALRSDGKDK